MKKIGILFGMEDTFPYAFIERVNSKNEKGIIAISTGFDVHAALAGRHATKPDR